MIASSFCLRGLLLGPTATSVQVLRALFLVCRCRVAVHLACIELFWGAKKFPIGRGHGVAKIMSGINLVIHPNPFFLIPGGNAVLQSLVCISIIPGSSRETFSKLFSNPSGKLASPEVCPRSTFLSPKQK